MLFKSMKKTNQNFFNTIQNKIINKIDLHNLSSTKLKSIKNKFTEKIKIYKKKNLTNSYLLPSIWIQNLQDKLINLSKNEGYNVVLKQTQFYTKTITWVIMGTTAFAVGTLSKRSASYL